eukprot:gene9483-12774_t
MNFSQEETEYTLNDNLTLLNSLWVTESNCPELLPYRFDIIDEMKEQLATQQDFIDKKFDEADAIEAFTSTLYQMDIERVRYTLTRYLRTRLLKIEKNVDFIMRDIDSLDRLSPQEKVFAEKLYNLNNQYFEEVVANKLTEEAKTHYLTNDDRLRNAEPKLTGFVFTHAKEDIRNIRLSSDHFYNLNQGDITILQYGVVRNHVLEGNIELL